MHELLLFGQVPARSHELVLKVLAGISASQPRVYTSHHLVFKPTRTSASITASIHAARANKASTAALNTQQATDVFYIQLVGHLTEKVGQLRDGLIEDTSFEMANDATKPPNEAARTGTHVDGVVDLKRCPWTIEYRDLPVAARQPLVTSRQLNIVPVTSGSPMAFVEDMGYQYTTSYLQHGHELIHNNIQLLLIRTLPIPQNTATSRDPPAAPEPSTLQPLDPSGGYVLQASVRAAEQKQEITNIGIKELTDLRTTLKGVVEMEVGDRLALDTRMR